MEFCPCFFLIAFENAIKMSADNLITPIRDKQFFFFLKKVPIKA